MDSFLQIARAQLLGGPIPRKYVLELAKVIDARSIASAGFNMSSSVADIMEGNRWKWPPSWNDYVPKLESPSLTSSSDSLFWRDRDDVFHNFSVSLAWEDLRSRADRVSWSNIVWFAGQIPKHAFILWLVFMKKLKTQDRMQNWDIQGRDPNELKCLLCNTQQDSHGHLFFDCPYFFPGLEYCENEG
uniref:uncharacterized protein LOC122583314 n=1 Tax=Erigeron canadensis TaxID=72917 RepID=UPI001CB9C212|nr:uncharacterized protein LOC122583314 [Erigeron canadensis]